MSIDKVLKIGYDEMARWTLHRPDGNDKKGVHCGIYYVIPEEDLDQFKLVATLPVCRHTEEVLQALLCQVRWKRR